MESVELKNTIIKITNSLGGLKGSLEMREKRFKKPEASSIEIINLINREEKGQNRTEQNNSFSDP